MDPFLEDPDVFPDLHDRMITYLSDAIQPRLPEPYYAMTRTRIWLEMAQRPIWPDVNVQRSNGGVHGGPAGGVAVAVRNTPVVVPVARISAWRIASR